MKRGGAITQTITCQHRTTASKAAAICKTRRMALFTPLPFLPQKFYGNVHRLDSIMIGDPDMCEDKI
jgi:hypothetical protein